MEPDSPSLALQGSRDRIIEGFARLAATPVSSGLPLRLSPTRLSSLPPHERKSGLMYLGWLFGPPLVLAVFVTVAWWIGEP